jgi:hypothetical protein
MRRPQEEENPLNKTLDEEVVRGKQERQTVLQRVRRQRASAIKRLSAKIARD